MSGKHGGSRLSGLLLALALAACNGDGGGGGEDAVDVTPPTIVSTLPVVGASGVTRSSAVSVTFSEAVTPAAGGAATLSLSAGALPVAGTVTIEGPVVTFTPSAPSAPLALGTLFTARVDIGLTDLAGNALAAPFTFTFTTEPAPWPGTRQLGTLAADSGNAVTMDGAGNAYVAGTTRGDLSGPSFGGADIFLTKFDLTGSRLFTRQLGTLTDDEAFAVAVDEAGNSYVVGTTAGDLDGPGIGDPFVGGTDFFLAKFGPTGNLLFTRQLGTLVSDGARGVAVDGVGNIYVAVTTGQDLDGAAGAGLVLGGNDIIQATLNAYGVLDFNQPVRTLTDDPAIDVHGDGVGKV
jgi:hypothetical protein